MTQRDRASDGRVWKTYRQAVNYKSHIVTVSEQFNLKMGDNDGDRVKREGQPKIDRPKVVEGASASWYRHGYIL